MFSKKAQRCSALFFVFANKVFSNINFFLRKFILIKCLILMTTILFK